MHYENRTNTVYYGTGRQYCGVFFKMYINVGFQNYNKNVIYYTKKILMITTFCNYIKKTILVIVIM